MHLSVYYYSHAHLVFSGKYNIFNFNYLPTDLRKKKKSHTPIYILHSCPIKHRVRCCVFWLYDTLKTLQTSYAKHHHCVKPPVSHFVTL